MVEKRRNSKTKQENISYVESLSNIERLKNNYQKKLAAIKDEYSRKQVKLSKDHVQSELNKQKTSQEAANPNYLEEETKRFFTKDKELADEFLKKESEALEDYVQSLRLAIDTHLEAESMDFIEDIINEYVTRKRMAEFNRRDVEITQRLHEFEEEEAASKRESSVEERAQSIRYLSERESLYKEASATISILRLIIAGLFLIPIYFVLRSAYGDSDNSLLLSIVAIFVLYLSLETFVYLEGSHSVRFILRKLKDEEGF